MKLLKYTVILVLFLAVIIGGSITIAFTVRAASAVVELQSASMDIGPILNNHWS